MTESFMSSDLLAEVQHLRKENKMLSEKVEHLEKFKSYVHKRLDAQGVPPDPYPELTAKNGCRIGGRLSWVREHLDGSHIAPVDIEAWPEERKKDLERKYRLIAILDQLTKDDERAHLSRMLYLLLKRYRRQLPPLDDYFHTAFRQIDAIDQSFGQGEIDMCIWIALHKSKHFWKAWEMLKAEENEAASPTPLYTGPVKVWLVGDGDYYAAETPEQAREAYIKETGDASYALLEPIPVSDENMETRTVTNEETGIEYTFRQELNRNMADPATVVPFMFCSINW